jgi:hypothetical protein
MWWPVCYEKIPCLSITYRIMYVGRDDGELLEVQSRGQAHTCASSAGALLNPYQNGVLAAVSFLLN